MSSSKSATPNRVPPFPAVFPPYNRSKEGGIADKLLLAQPYQDELWTVLLHRKVLAYTTHVYEDKIHKLEQGENSDNEDSGADGEFERV
jgi:hypothetical protein